MGKHSFIRKGTVIGLLCCLSVLLGFIFPRGMYLTSDDAEYSLAAYHIAQGNFQLPTNHFNARIGHTFSMALFYALFGVNDYSARGASQLFTVLNILLIFLLSQEIFEKNKAFKVGIFGALLFIFVPINIEMSSSFLPHQGQTFFMLSSIYLLLRGERNKAWYHYVLSGLAIGIAYLFHDVGVFALFMVIGYGLMKIFQKKWDKRLLLIVCGFLLIFAGENFFYYSKTGRLLYRQRATLKTHFKVTEVRAIEDILKVGKEFLEPLENPFSGTLIGDSWMLEPFRQLVLNPTHSILFLLFFPLNIMLLLKKDKHIIFLNMLFWPLFLYLSYGSPNPIAYYPLRRLPRYFHPCMFLACIMVGYGIVRLFQRRAIQYGLIGIFIPISLFCVTIKGGDIGQRMHQSRFFYEFMQAHSDEQFVTDSMTALGLRFLARYQELPTLTVLDFRIFLTEIQTPEFLQNHSDAYLFITIPEVYGKTSIELGQQSYELIAQHDRKPRKICHIQMIHKAVQESLCDLSNGGQIYRIR